MGLVRQGSFAIGAPLLLAIVMLATASRSAEAGLVVLHDFQGAPTDGSQSWTSLIQVGDDLYGTTSSGGTPGSSDGTVFKIGRDGTGYSLVQTFSSSGGPAGSRGSLIAAGTTLYGTTRSSVFKVNADGSG